ncbi:DUF3344 domain-containing protein [Methanofollis formosanus]|nr:DUF3344 domain-containing protein [Methanofollis formosanus]
MRIPLLFLSVWLCLALVLVPAASAEEEMEVTTEESLQPDLEVSFVAPNMGKGNEFFAHGPNTVTATILNNGTAAAPAFTVRFEINGAEETVNVQGLGAGNETRLTVTDPVLRNYDDEVTVTVTADPEGAIDPAAQDDNLFTIMKKVVHNGYRGKRYTDGDDLDTMTKKTFNGGLAYSFGDSAYKSGKGGWTEYTANWTVADLALPENATVDSAYLGVAYTWDVERVVPDAVSLAFNGADAGAPVHFSDQKMYGSYDHPAGMVVYDVKDHFDRTGNAAVLTRPAESQASFNGMVLIVVYDDPGAGMKQVVINAGYDIISGKEKYSSTPEQATAYAPFVFTSPEGATVGAVRLITLAPGAASEGTLLFGDGTWTDVWDYAGSSYIGLDDRFVTGHLNESPVAQFRSGENDYFDAAAAILVLDYGTPDLEVAAVKPNAGQIFANEPNTITATVKNNGTADLGTFVVRFDINGEVQDVTVPFLAAGETLDLSVTDETIRALDNEVTVKVSVDATGEVDETDETDNMLTIEKTVVYNGYKGKRYTDGDDLTTMGEVTVTGDLLYSTGDSVYKKGKGGGTEYTANWTAADLPLPEGTSVDSAFLGVAYTWDVERVIPENVSLTFNGEKVESTAYFSDQKMHGSYDHPAGIVIYDVSDHFNRTGNAAVLTKVYESQTCFNGMVLIVVYADSSAGEKQILFNAGYDILSAREKYATTPEEATAYAPFDVALPTGSRLDAARLITVVPGAEAEGTLLFGDGTWTDAWNYAGSSHIGIAEHDVTEYLDRNPVALFRSEEDDYFDAAAAILVISRDRSASYSDGSDDDDWGTPSAAPVNKKGDEKIIETEAGSGDAGDDDGTEPGETEPAPTTTQTVGTTPATPTTTPASTTAPTTQATPLPALLPVAALGFLIFVKRR